MADQDRRARSRAALPRPPGGAGHRRDLRELRGPLAGGVAAGTPHRPAGSTRPPRGASPSTSAPTPHRRGRAAQREDLGADGAAQRLAGHRDDVRGRAQRRPRRVEPVRQPPAARRRRRQPRSLRRPWRSTGRCSRPARSSAATRRDAGDDHVRRVDRGFGQGELFALQWDDVEEDEIIVRRSRKLDGSLGPPKNGQSRTIPLLPPARVLDQVPRREGSPFVFHSPQGKPLIKGTHGWSWQKVKAAARVDDPLARPPPLLRDAAPRAGPRPLRRVRPARPHRRRRPGDGALRPPPRRRREGPATGRVRVRAV